MYRHFLRLDCNPNNEKDMITSSSIKKQNKYYADLVSLARSIVVFAMIALSLLVERKDYYTEYFDLYMCIELTLVVLLVVLMLNKRQLVEAFELDWLAIVFWGMFALYTLASDTLVDKHYRFSETAIFLTMFIFGYVWNRRSNAEVYIRDFERAIQWFLVFLIIVSLIFPVESNTPGRYNGPIANPSVYALYLCSIWAVLLGSLENGLLHNENRGKTVLTVIELFVTFVLMLLSQSLTPMIALFAVTILFLFRLTMLRKGRKYAVMLFLIIGLLLLIMAVTLVIWIRSLQDISGSRLIEKIQSADISAFLSGRDYYWRRYFREMNVLGHSKKPRLWDHRILPHNALVGVMYTYGVPCVIPYIIMMIMAIEKSFRFANTPVLYAAVPFYSIVSFVIMSMADNVEQPFVWLPWISCYLMLAPVLLRQEKTKGI